MQWSRVKSILVVILVAVDAFLLMTILGGYVSEHRREQSKSENFISVLSEKGIMTDADFRLPQMLSLPLLEIDRSKNDEDSFTKGLLGGQPDRVEDSNGNTLYSNDYGKIEWTSDGKIFGYYIPEGYKTPKSERDIRLMTAKTLEHCGIKSSIQIEVYDETKSALAVFDTAGAPVFNRFLRFTFGNDRVSVTGWWTFQTPYMVRTNNYVNCEASDAIMALIKENDKIKTIESAEIGYILSNSSGRRLAITPCCRILTDQGEFFVDSLKNIVIYQ